MRLLPAEKWHSGRYTFTLLTWACCGLRWEILLSTRFPGRGQRQPVCPMCGAGDRSPPYDEAADRASRPRKLRHGALIMWTLYDHPSDFPDHYVARKFVNGRPVDEVLVARALAPLRETFAANGLTPIARAKTDDPVIIETWL